jgi:peptide/nickel transport system permease protein
MKLNGDLKTGLILSALVMILSCTGLFWTPYDCNRMDSASRFTPPGLARPLGTDNFGRDLLSRIMTGGRYTLLTALSAVAGSAFLGTLLGLAAGYAGGLLDELVMRLMDALSSFPGILLALVMVSLMGNSQGTLILALTLLFIPGFTRILRSGTLEFKGRDFVKAAEILGASHGRILFVHILPNLLPSLFSAAALGLSNAVLAEAAMSYLGLGIQPPAPSWGRMLSESQHFLFNAPWCALAPGLMIALTVLAFHCLGEGLRRRFC